MHKRIKRSDQTKKRFITIKRFFVFGLIVFLGCLLASGVIALRQFIFNQPSGTIMNPAIAEVSMDELSSALRNNNITFENINTTDSGDTFTVKLVHGPTVTFSRVKDLQFQVKTLVELLSRLSIDNKQPVAIEFQYSKPIVKF